MAIGKILLPQKAYNLDLLYVELKAALGARSDGTASDKVDRVLRQFAILIDPNAGDEAIAISVATAHNSAVLSPEQQTHADIKVALQGVAGVSWSGLTAIQVRALVALLLHERGGLAPDGTVRPPGQWVR